jgi:tetratricopeptide (TPR) repeat protein
MKYPILFIFFLTLIITSFLTPGYGSDNSTNSAEVQEETKAKLEEAKRIYFDYYKDSMNLDRSIKILEGILENDPENTDALIFLSRIWLTYGYAKAPNDKEKLRVFKNGINAAEKAMEIAPHDPDAHFFYVANLGSWGEARGVLKSLFLLPEIKRELNLVLELDPNHVYGLGMTGLLYYTLPNFMGGDLHLSEIYLRKAIALDPHLTTLKIHLAKTLIKQKRFAEAKKILEGVIEEKTPTVYADWKLNKEMAEEMIIEIRKKSRRTPPPHTIIFPD